MIPKKFNLKPGKLTRYFLVLIVVLLVTMGVLVQSSVNTWLRDKSYQLADISRSIHKRIDTYRYVTWQVYDSVAAGASPSTDGALQESRLRQNIYYLEKPHRKTEALIVGDHDSTTLDMGQRLSAYLDILWGAESAPWSMYYLNGQDNSMLLVSTLPLKDLSSSLKESGLESMLDARKSELLQQANALDERESFSELRRLSWQNGRYITLRTTFNQPGHLATVVAFDMPINDLIPPEMPVDNFRLDETDASDSGSSPSKDGPSSVSVAFNGTGLEISAPLSTTQLQLIWQVPFASLLADTLQSILLPLLLNIGLLALALFGYTTFRNPEPRPDVPGGQDDNRLQRLRALNEEIVALLPLGLIVQDMEANRTVLSNAIADQLLPHLNLQNIAALADRHQGVIQATVNNELYEIRQFSSQISPRLQIFVIRDQDKEILVNKKLRQAQRLYEKNQHGRTAFMHHIGHALKAPAERLLSICTGEDAPAAPEIREQSARLARLVDEIALLTTLEDNSWPENISRFTLQDAIDEVVPQVLPAVKRKGLQLLINNSVPDASARHADRTALQTIVRLLIEYSVITTAIGKIVLDITADETDPTRVTLRILDTGHGINHDEIDNLHFPFLNPTSSDDVANANGLTFYLCNQLARKLGGHLSIKSREDLGTRYSVHLVLPQDSEAETKAGAETDGEQEGLLEGVVAMVDVTANEVRQIVTRQMESWGADCITPDERQSRQDFDLFITDNPSNLTSSGLLLSDDEDSVRQIGPGQYRVNFNISHVMLNAVLQLIEEQLVAESVTPPAAGTDESAQLHASGYYALFVDTVPEDVEKLYTESATGDFTALAQTAHRLKGVFAMLNLEPGKRLCETLEHHIRDKDASAIEKFISDIDAYVKTLL